MFSLRRSNLEAAFGTRKGDSHEEPWIDVSDDYPKDIERHVGDSLSGFAKTSRRSSKGRGALRAEKTPE
jgi:hypothetical protein